MDRYKPTTSEIKELYNKTEGLKRGMLDCKVALTLSNGDMEMAIQMIVDRQWSGDIRI